MRWFGMCCANRAASLKAAPGQSAIEAGGDGISDLAVGNFGTDLISVLLAEPWNATAAATGIAVPAATGTHQVVANYSGDSNFSSSTSGAVSLTAALGAPTVSLAASSTEITSGTSITFTVTVTGSGLPPSGAVNFLNGSTALGTSTLNSSCVATLMTSALAAGSDNITASYAGDTNYSSATSAVVVVLVSSPAPPSFALTNSGNITVNPGAATGNISTISVTPSGGFTGAVSLSCAVAPVAASDPATCALSPASVTISGATALTSTLSITTTAATTAALVHTKPNKAPWRVAGGATLAWGILLFVFPARRRRLRTMLGVIVLFACVVGGVVSCGGGGSGNGGGGGAQRWNNGWPLHCHRNRQYRIVYRNHHSYPDRELALMG